MSCWLPRHLTKHVSQLLASQNTWKLNIGNGCILDSPFRVEPKRVPENACSQVKKEEAEGIPRRIIEELFWLSCSLSGHNDGFG